FAADEFTKAWAKLRMVLEDAHGKKTRQELRAEWPADYPRPADTTLYRWLTRGVSGGLICQEGTGRRADPFRYFLPGREKEWEKDPLYMLDKQLAEDRKELD